MKFYLHTVQDAEEKFGKDETKTLSENISIWTREYIKLHSQSQGLLFNPQLKYGDKGKPYFLHNPDLHFSVSHTHTHIAIVFCDSPIGIDIENTRKANLNLTKRYFHPHEHQTLLNTPIEDRDHNFTKLWTLKESYVKCIGTGISGMFTTFSINIHTHPNPTFNTPTLNNQYKLSFRHIPHKDLYLSICIGK